MDILSISANDNADHFDEQTYEVYSVVGSVRGKNPPFKWLSDSLPSIGRYNITGT